MKNTKIKIKIEFEDTNSDVNLDAQNLEDGTFEIVFSQEEENIIEEVSKHCYEPIIRH